jgi:hypothetical protein
MQLDYLVPARRAVQAIRMADRGCGWEDIAVTCQIEGAAARAIVEAVHEERSRGATDES